VSFDMPGSAVPPRRPVSTPRRRNRALLPTLVILGALLIMFSIFTGFYTDLLWFRSVGFTSFRARAELRGMVERYFFPEGTEPSRSTETSREA
jgi:hypothetical protein